MKEEKMTKWKSNLKSIKSLPQEKLKGNYNILNHNNRNNINNSENDSNAYE